MTTTSQTQERIPSEMDQETAMLLQLSQEAEPAPEPDSQFSRSQVIHRPDSDLELPVITAALKSAGYAYIYDTENGERSITNNNMLLTQLRKKRADGSRVFGTHAPENPPKRGTLKCRLHADSPERAAFDDLGFATCQKSNLVSKYQVQRHMERRHNTEWQTIQQERSEVERQQDRATQNRLAEVMADAAQGSAAKQLVSSTTCPTCGEMFEGKNRRSVNMKIKNHQMKAHA